MEDSGRGPGFSYFISLSAIAPIILLLILWGGKGREGAPQQSTYEVQTTPTAQILHHNP